MSKYKLGDVAYLKSAYAGGGQPVTVLEVHPVEEEHQAQTYGCMLQAKDGSTALTLTLPEFGLCSPRKRKATNV